MNSWIIFVKKYSKDNNIPYKQALKECKIKIGGSFNSDIVARIISNNPEKFDPTKINNPSEYIKKDRIHFDLLKKNFEETNKKLLNYDMGQHEIRQEINKLETLDRRRKENKNIDEKIENLINKKREQARILDLYGRKNKKLNSMKKYNYDNYEFLVI